MTTSLRLLLIVLLGAIGAAIAQMVDAGGTAIDLVVLGAGIAAGELVRLRPPNRDALPISYAVILVVLRAGSPAEFVVTVLAAQAVALVLRPAPDLRHRLSTTATRLAAAAGALGAYTLVLDVAGDNEARAVVLVALALAGVAEIAVHDLCRMLGDRRWHLSVEGRSADLALLTSGMLMAVGYAGIGGGAAMGLWAPVLFTVPLLAAWYSFERLASIRSTYEQTITALSVVPELAGIVRSGHAERVADLSLKVGRELGLDRHELEYLRAAALLHHLGGLCLEDPEVRGRAIEPSEVTDKGAEILRQTEYLAPAGDILASDTWSVGGQILRVVSAYDELTAGDPALAGAAIEALYSGPGYVYDVRVLAALERATGRDRTLSH